MALEDNAATDAMSRFRRWVAVAVAVATLLYLGFALYTGFSETASELLTFNWSYAVPILGLTLVNYGLRYAKWHYLLGQLGVHIPHSTNLPIFLAGLAMVISPAKAGEVVKPYLVRVVSGTPMTRTIPALVAERGTDGIAVVVLAAIGVGTFLPDASLFVGAVLFCTAAGLVVMASERLSSLLTRALSALPVIGRFSARIEELMMALRTCLAPVPLAITVAASLVAWWAECLGYWLVFQGMDVAAPLDTATFLYAWSTVFGAPAPGGIGLADATLSGGALQFIPGLSDGGAVASSLIIRVATLWFGVVLGAIALLRMESVVQRALKG